MPVTISARHFHQNVNYPYNFLFDPYLVKIVRDPASPTHTYVDVKIRQGDPSAWGFGGTVIPDVGRFYYDSNGEVYLDAMKIVRDYAETEFFNIGNISHFADWTTIMTSTMYNLWFYSQGETSGSYIVIAPFIGSRGIYEQESMINPVLNPIAQNAWDMNGMTQPDFIDKYRVNVEFKNPGFATGIIDSDIRPTVTVVKPSTGLTHCGSGYLIWKSKQPGWTHFPFDRFTEDVVSEYQGDLEADRYGVGSGGSITIPANYTGKASRRVYSLASTSVSNSYKKVLQEIQFSPAIYLVRDPSNSDDPIELVRLDSVSASIDPLSDGGPISVRLTSIEQQTINAR